MLEVELIMLITRIIADKEICLWRNDNKTGCDLMLRD